jgi:hypothetical protein
MARVAGSRRVRMTCIYCTSLLPWPSFMASTSQVHFPSHVPLPFPFDNTNPIIQSLHMSKFQNAPTLAPILLTNVYFLRDATNIAIKTMCTTIVEKVGVVTHTPHNPCKIKFKLEYYSFTYKSNISYFARDNQGHIFHCFNYLAQNFLS